MSYFLDLFSPETYEAFSRSDREIRIRRRRQSPALDSKSSSWNDASYSRQFDGLATTVGR
jgi:hypothetical protein